MRDDMKFNVRFFYEIQTLVNTPFKKKIGNTCMKYLYTAT